MALISTLIANKRLSKFVYLSLVIIFVGVTITVFGEMKLSIVGLVAVLIGNLSSASRNVFYNTSSNESTSDLRAFCVICLFSTILFLPVLGFKLLAVSYQTGIVVYRDIDKGSVYALLLSSFFHFSYNLFSFRILVKVSAVSHSVINVMKRVVIIVASLLSFGIEITPVQVIGIFVSNVGVWLYIKHKKTTENKQTTTISDNAIAKKTILVVLVMLIYGCGLFEVFRSIGQSSFMLAKPTLEYKRLETWKRPVYFLNDTMKTRIKNDLIFKQQVYNENRIKCIQNIKKELKETFSAIITAGSKVHLFDVPHHQNHGDTLIL